MSEDKRVNLFGLSGGKDSTALWAWAIHESGYPKESIVGAACDTENEYDEVYDQIAALDAYGQLYGVRPIVILRSMGFLNLCIKKKRFPSAKARFCTEELKIKPTQNYVKKLQESGFEVVTHSGVRRSESIERAALEEWSDNGVLGIKERRPLLDRTITHVWDMHKKYGLPINPLYLTGRKRVGCRLCVMSRKDDVRLTVKTHPAVIDEYRDWERKVSEAGKGSTFFGPGVVPAQGCSLEVVNKSGERVRVPTIDDVAKWAFTLRGGTQTGFDFMFDDSPIYELDDAHAPCKSGFCE